VALLQSGSTTTTDGAAGSTAPTEPPTTVTAPPGLHDSGAGTPGLATNGSTPEPAPTLPFTGGPHAAGLLALAGLGVVLGGTELRRRLLRPETDGAR